MIDLGRARMAETNFPIARYREGTEWETVSERKQHVALLETSAARVRRK